MSPGDVDSVGAASHAISEAMRFAPVPDAVRDEVARRYAELGRAAGRRPLERARRGQPGRDVRGPAGDVPLGARRRPRLRRRARLLGEPLQPAGDRLPRAPRRGEEPAMGVAVQLMVDAEVSGVLFTCNPVSGDPSMVAVNASWGLGLAVVGGEVTPDDYLVSKVTRRGRARARSTARTSSTCRTPVGAARSGSTCPTERRERAVPRRRGAGRARGGRRPHRAVLRLAPGRRVGDRRGGELPASLFVVQSRPVTAMQRPRGTPAATSAMALVMSAFGAGERRTDVPLTTTTSARSCGSSTSPTSTSCASRPASCRSTSCVAGAVPAELRRRDRCRRRRPT